MGFWLLQFKNHIKCPQCGATGRMSLSPQRDSGWCGECLQRSELDARLTRWSRRKVFGAIGITIGVTSNLITIGGFLSKFIPKRHHVGHSTDSLLVRRTPVAFQAGLRSFHAEVAHELIKAPNQGQA